MWTNTTSIAQAQGRIRSFKPPYCANSSCYLHYPENQPPLSPFRDHGVKVIQRFPYISPRFRCTNCRRTFSASFFSLVYRDKKNDRYEEIFEAAVVGVSKRASALKLQWDEDTVRRKRKKLTRWALLAWGQDYEKIKIEESVAFDGLENFAFSQYDPNNLNHAVGRESLYVYDFNLSPMNRKGSMSGRQVLKKKRLEEEHGRYPSRAIENDSLKLFDRLLSKAGELTLHTDNHFAYRHAIKKMKNKDKIIHLITPAKVARNFRNRLFAINHTDLLSRHQLSDYKRETIAFAKTSVSMLESFVLLAVKKNYLRTKFTKKHKRDPTANTHSPAMMLGLRNRVLNFREFFKKRICLAQVALPEDWLALFRGTHNFSRRTIRGYKGI